MGASRVRDEPAEDSAAGVLILKIRIPSLPPAEYGANKSRGADWGRQYRVSHGKRGAAEEIHALVMEQGWQGEPLEKAMIKVTFGLPDRRKRDHGGLVERFKPWLDGLVSAGVLTDDSLEVIGWPEYSHCYSPRCPFTEIEVLGCP